MICGSRPLFVRPLNSALVPVGGVSFPASAKSAASAVMEHRVASAVTAFERSCGCDELRLDLKVGDLGCLSPSRPVILRDGPVVPSAILRCTQAIAHCTRVTCASSERLTARRNAITAPETS